MTQPSKPAPTLPPYYGKPISTPNGHHWAGYTKPATADAGRAAIATTELPGQDAPDVCDCCQERPGRNLAAGDWLCDPCESYVGTRLARQARQLRGG